MIDGLDQLATASSAAVHAALDALVTDPGLSRVRLVVTSRPDTPRPAGASEVRLDVAPDADIRSYLARRKVPESLHGAIAVRAGGNWLIASLLADQALKAPGIAPESLPSDLAGLYAQNLRQAGAWATESWRGEFRPVLGALAAAGVGPILPLKLLCAASVRLGGPDRPPRVRDRLVDLRGLVVRARPGTDDEHVGLFHQTLADYLLDPASDPFGIDPQEPHRALAEAIAELAPAESHDPADSAVDVLVEAPPMIGRVGPMRRRSLMGGRRGPARSAGRPGPCQGVETGTQLESRTSCVPVSTPSPFPAPTPRHRFFRIAPTVTALRGRRLDS